MTENKRKGYATQQQQAEANKRWAENNRQHRTYLSARSSAKTFIRKYATKEDLEALKDLIKKRETEL